MTFALSSIHNRMVQTLTPPRSIQGEHGRGPAHAQRLSGSGDRHVCLPLVRPPTLPPGGQPGSEAPRLPGAAQLHPEHGAEPGGLLLGHPERHLRRGDHGRIDEFQTH